MVVILPKPSEIGKANHIAPEIELFYSPSHYLRNAHKIAKICRLFKLKERGKYARI